MIEVLWLLLLVAASYGAGSFVLNILEIKLEGWDEFLFAQVMGFVLLAYITLIVGSLGLLQSSYFRIGMLAIAVLALFKVKRLATRAIKILAATQKLRFYSMITLGLFALAVLNIIAAHAPVTSSDAAAYHVAAPKIFASHGSISYIPFMLTSSYPMMTDMLFLDGYMLSGGVMAEVIAAYIAIIAALAVYLFARKYFNGTTAILSAAIFYTLPIVSVFNVRGFVDISAAMFGMAAVYALFMWNESNDMRMLALGGLFAGAAAATKISAYAIPASLLLMVGYCLIVLKKNRFRDAAKNGMPYIIGVAVALLPWMLRAAIYTSNPVFPLLSNIFGGPISKGLAAFWVDSLAFIGFGTSMADLIMLPWNLTMNSAAFGEKLGIGPVFLAFIPLIFLIKKVDRKIFGILGLAIPLVLVWFYTAQSPRYIFLVYALLSIAAGYSISRIAVGKMAGPVLGVVAFTLALNGLFWIGANNDELQVVAGLTGEDDFIAEKMSNYELLKWANLNLDDANICLYGEIRGYYSSNDYVWCHPLFQGYVDFFTIDDSGKLLERMEEVGITHLLVENDVETFRHYGSVTVAAPIVANADRMIRELVESNVTSKVFETSEGSLYKLPAKPYS